jgi:hypothetical protein
LYFNDDNACGDNDACDAPPLPGEGLEDVVGVVAACANECVAMADAADVAAEAVIAPLPRSRPASRNA